MANDAVEPEQPAPETHEEDEKAVQPSKIGLTGFSIMCAWHFLMIFTAVFNLSPWVSEGRLVWMQLTLYLALAVTYGIVALASRHFVTALFRSGISRWRVTNVGIAALASVASVLVILSYQTPLPWQVFTYILLGVSGALLIFPWLQLPQVSHDAAANYQNLAFNMGVGSLFAFGISFLQSPVVYIAVCALPLLSNTLLIRQWDGSPAPAGEEATEQEDGGKRPFAEAFTSNLHFLMYGIAFGFVQGMFANDIQVNFTLNDGWPLLGATLSALVVFFVPEKYLHRNGIFTLQRASMLIMFAGLFCAVFFYIPNDTLSDAAKAAGFKASQVLTFGGFNIFEFGFMIFSLSWAARLKNDYALFIGCNRVMLYTGMLAGLAVGFAAYWFCHGLQGFYLLSQGVVIVFLTFLTLPIFDEFAPYGTIAAASAASDEASEHEGPDGEQGAEQPAQEETGSHTVRWKDRVDAIADSHDLSEREREVFVYLAKGRNAAYIQQELWISIHTVKTHIANIYRKLDVHSLQEVIDMVEASAGTPQGGRQDGKEEG